MGKNIPGANFVGRNFPGEIFLEPLLLLFRMQSQRPEPRQIYKETSLLQRPNIFFFLKRYFGDTIFDL